MSSQERKMKMGELADLTDKERRAKNRADGILRSIREAAYVSPLASPFDLDGRKIRDYSDEFLEVQAEGAKLLEAIDQLKDDLGMV